MGSLRNDDEKVKKMRYYSAADEQRWFWLWSTIVRDKGVTVEPDPLIFIWNNGMVESLCDADDEDDDDNGYADYQDDDIVFKKWANALQWMMTMMLAMQKIKMMMMFSKRLPINFPSRSVGAIWERMGFLWTKKTPPADI